MIDRRFIGPSAIVLAVALEITALATTTCDEHANPTHYDRYQTLAGTAGAVAVAGMLVSIAWVAIDRDRARRGGNLATAALTSTIGLLVALAALLLWFAPLCDTS